MKKHNDLIKYLLINIILFVIAIILVGIISFVYKNIRNNILSNLIQETNILISDIDNERISETYENNNLPIEVIEPSIVGENTNESISQTIETTKIKYYYDQLGDNARLIYDEIEKNIDNIKTGTYIINLPSSTANVLEDENGTEKLNRDFQTAWDAIIMDRVDLFYIDVSKIVLKISKTTYLNRSEYTLTIEPNESENYLEDGFYSKKDVNKAIEQTENIKKEIISTLSGNNYNKAKMIHDYLIKNMEYGTNISGNNSYNIYGALIDKSAVCEGYAEAFKYILDDIGIPCIIVSGTAQNSEGITENHEWNYVKLNGKWYGVDVTWDDPIIVGGGSLTESEKHKYFLKGATTINKNHFPNGAVSNNGVEFKYPELAIEDY